MRALDDREFAHDYEMWDAAYVLGSLSAAERRDYESHLLECPSCRAAVTELSGMPALLSHLDHDVVASLDQAGGADQPRQPPELLRSLLVAVRRQRRRSRLAWASTAVAAAVLAIGVFVGVAGNPAPPPQAQVATLPMAQMHTALLAATVSLSDEDWGTVVKLRCVCLAPGTAAHDTLAMVVVGRDGQHGRLASWVAQPGHTATPTGSTSMSADQIAAVQVVAADSGEVLLQRTL